MELPESLHQNLGVHILPQAFQIPSKIEAEYFAEISGFDTEECMDNNGGENILSNSNNFSASYNINNTEDTDYTIKYRVSGGHAIGLIEVKYGDSVLDTLGVHNIGGTQDWKIVYTYTVNNPG